MPKQKEKDGVEFWRAQCRKLQKEVQQLRRELMKRQQSQDDNDIAQDSEDTPPAQFVDVTPCSECGKGFLEIFEIIGKRYGTCNTCGHRERLE